MAKTHGATVAALLLGAIVSFQNCSAPLTESVESTPQIRVLNSPTPIPTAPPTFTTPTPTPPPTATPVGATPTPTPTPVAVTMEYWSRYYNPSTRDHMLARESSPPGGYTQEGGWRFVKTAPNMADLLPVYQCTGQGQSMLTTNPNCEQLPTKGSFGSPVALGIYVYRPDLAQPANTQMLYRREADSYGITMPTHDPNESSPLFHRTISLGWVYPF